MHKYLMKSLSIATSPIWLPALGLLYLGLGIWLVGELVYRCRRNRA